MSTSRGVVYTPPGLARRALERLPAPPARARVADLSCGEGVWLEAAAARWPGVRLFGVDIDRAAVSRARRRVQGDFVVGDGLHAPLEADLVVGNPPWGAGRAPKVRRGAESASAFVERAVEILAPGGWLCLLLPEAWLEVAAHRRARARLLESATVEHVERLGHVFTGVLAPTALLIAKKGATGQSPEVFAPELPARARRVLDKLDGRTLAGRVTFILGVVTGQNRRALGPLEGEGEPILVGTDIAPFSIAPPSRKLRVPLSRVQQAAPRAAYSRRKIVYRFIARHPVAAVDEAGRLTLNSANALAVDDPALDETLVAAVLNSTAIRFAHAARHRLPRMLRAHLEQVPIPAVDGAEKRRLARLAADGNAAALDERVMDLFGLDDGDRRLLRSACRSF